MISEIDATVRSIRKARDQARASSSHHIGSVTTGIAGNHIKSYNGNASINIENDEVTEEDKEKVIQNASDISIPGDQEILHRIPQYYNIDEQTFLQCFSQVYLFLPLIQLRSEFHH